MTQVLYNKWRPQKWEEIVGQQHVVQTLRNAVAGNRVGHAYLFAGPRGTGKTTAARLLAKAVNCLDEDPSNRPCNQCSHCLAVNENRFLDLIEIDAASNTSVDDIRALRDKINFVPTQGNFKIYIIDEVHMLSTAAFNALLKTLEEPPAHAIFILATTEIHKIPATVLSRCQRHEFRRLPVNDIVSQLQNIAKSENLTVEAEAMLLIARQSAGGMRDAISLLDQMSSTGKEITLGMTQTVLGTATSQTVIELISAVLDHEPAEGMNAIHSALDAGTDPRQLARQVVDYLRVILLLQMGNGAQVDLVRETRTQAEKHARSFSPQEVLRMIKIFNIAATDMRGGWQPSLKMELALADSLDASKNTEQLIPPLGSSNQEREKVEKPIKGSMKAPETGGQATKVQVNTLFQEVSKSAEENGKFSIEKLSKDWKQIKALIKPKDPSLEGLLNSCKLMELKNGILVIGFTSDLLRSKVDIPEKMEITRKAIKEVCGGELAIKCVLISAKQAAPLEVKADGMVAAALKKGGEIVDIQE